MNQSSCTGQHVEIWRNHQNIHIFPGWLNHVGLHVPSKLNKWYHQYNVIRQKKLNWWPIPVFMIILPMGTTRIFIFIFRNSISHLDQFKVFGLLRMLIANPAFLLVRLNVKLLLEVIAWSMQRLEAKTSSKLDTFMRVMKIASWKLKNTHE
jgi:hypothetical protein